jgi:ankyrin repeat protein
VDWESEYDDEAEFEPRATDWYSVFRADDVSTLISRYELNLDPDETCGRPADAEKGDLFKHSPSLLCVASHYGSVSCVHFLLAHNADASFRDQRGRSPSLFAAAGGSLSVLQLFWEAGVDAAAADCDGNGLLHWAVLHRRLPVLLWTLFMTSIPASVANRRRVTPLHIAATERLAEYIRVLCVYGADPNAKTDVRFARTEEQHRCTTPPRSP